MKFCHNRFRVICHKICNHPYFGNIVLACILISSGMLAAEDPLQSQSKRNEVSLPINSNNIEFTVQSNTFYVHLKCFTDIDSYWPYLSNSLPWQPFVWQLLNLKPSWIHRKCLVAILHWIIFQQLLVYIYVSKNKGLLLSDGNIQIEGNKVWCIVFTCVYYVTPKLGVNVKNSFKIILSLFILQLLGLERVT